MSHALKHFLDWDTRGTAMLGATGFASSNFDNFIGKTIALITLALLLRKAWVVFVKGKDKE